jgi:hypothetical protein
MSKKSYDVFISYSSIDKQTAFEICYILEQQDLKCWIAPRDITIGQPYASEIMKGIRATKIVVLVMSENSLNSEYVLQEIKNAADYQRPILPFKIDDALPGKDMGYYIDDKHWLEAFPDPQEKYDILIRNALRCCGEDCTRNVNWTLEGFNPNDIVRLKKDWPSLILLCTPLYWASFIYMGILGNVNMWKVAGFIYLIPSVVCVILFFQIWGLLFLFYPVFLTFLGLFFIFWILAFAHGWFVRNDFLTKKSILRLLSSNPEVYQGLIEQYSKF